MDIRLSIMKVLDEMGIYTTDINLKEDIDLTKYIADSIMFISFVVDLEEKLKIEIPDELLQVKNIVSLNGFANSIELLIK
ncbi:hypothetical protein SH1V18_28710 [Vallitalea longa]|uniref:Carrier domain-containing protein n=1 Tax=Vallitalea longa TaxID=2936439 RepID=A0A9W6DEP1_9FIRM|nr:phosphopantetheine-binding protein [Vallitalea longa]GKX30391.1 hypothetical protein SH1V18_28710 [Vallitalea longa]